MFFQVPRVKYIVLIMILLGLPAMAGVIELHNGDRLEGQVVKLDGEQLVWKSTNFGEQTLRRSAIKAISTSQMLKINGSNEACKLLALDGDQLKYTCGDDATQRQVSFLTLKVMAPFESYKKDSFTHHGRVNLWGAYSRGNEVRDEWNLQSEVDLRRGEFRHVLGADYAKSSWFYSEPQVRWNARYSLDWFLGERWFWYNNTVIGADPRRGMEDYLLVGSGAGYQFWETKKTALSLKGGIAYLDENYLPPSATTTDFVLSDNFMAARLGLDFRYSLPFGVSFFHNNELIHSLEDGADWRLKTTSGLSSMILSRVFAEFKCDYSRDNHPQPGRDGEDLRLSMGASYKW